jgi:hypothetical protein
MTLKGQSSGETMRVQVLAVVLSLCSSVAAGAEEKEDKDSNEALAKASQNPVGDIISIPFQNNTNFGYGPGNGQTQNILNIQPVLPFHLGEDWNLITRTIFPLVWQPSFTGGGTTFGMAGVSFTAFLSPAKPGELIWGVGPVLTFPATSAAVGSTNTWGIGPSAVVLTIQGPWVIGVLANNVWSFAGASTNNFLLQYFINYNFGKTGWYLTSAPIITADWKAASGQQWVVPFGAGGGKIVRFGKLPVNFNLSAYYNVVHPDIGPLWQLRFAAIVLLPASLI